MAKKYLSLPEAAQKLGISEDDLKARREANDIRGFADRGNWKFRAEDVEELGRSMTADSDPDVPIMADDSAEIVVADTAADFVAPPAAGMGTEMMDESAGSVLDDEEFGEEPTVIRKKNEDLSSSDSDVRLILDESAALSASDPKLAGALKDDSDSDVKLVPGTDSDVRLADSAFDDSDSDVKLVDAGGSSIIADAGTGDSDSDVRLSGHEMDIASDDSVPVTADSDSDVTIAPDSASEIILADSVNEFDVPEEEEAFGSASDSDVRLVEDESSLDIGDVAAAGAAAAGLAVGAKALTDDSADDVSVADDSGVALDFDDDGDDSASVLLGAEDSGVSLASDSGISLESVSDSGISLDDSSLEEGISLSDDSAMLLSDDSGIALEAIGDSGISLDDDSGIALDGGSEVAAAADDGTDAEFDLVGSDDGVDATQFEIDGGDSEFDLDTEDATAEFDAADMLSDGGVTDDSVEGEFDLGDDDFEDGTFDSLDAASVADIDLLDADDAFDDDYGADADAGYGAVPVARGRVEQDWSTGTVVMTGVATLLSVLAAVMMFDLVNNIYSWEAGEPLTGFLIEPLAGMFQS